MDVFYLICKMTTFIPELNFRIFVWNIEIQKQQFVIFKKIILANEPNKPNEPKINTPLLF